MGANAQHFINQIVTEFIPLMLSLAVHEWGHAAAAVALGDHTPRDQGRFTLNPVVHLDWLGSVVLPLVLIAFRLPLVGWAKPVQVTPQRFTRRLRMRTGVWLTAAAGPAMNLLLAVGGAILWGASIANGHSHTVLAIFLEQLFTLNIVLFFLNLLPIPPLDGGRVLRAVLPAGWQKWGTVLERIGPTVLAVVLVTGAGAFLIRGPSFALDNRLQEAAGSVLSWMSRPH